jgi:radical SAM protein with 4Fe4S-binding SPASM domain
VLGQDISFGNILDSSFSDIIGSCRHSELVQIAMHKPAKCSSCEFLRVCNNGCVGMRKSGSSNNRLGLYAYCEQRLALFEKVNNSFSLYLD